jgi:hypothetical protein
MIEVILKRSKRQVGFVFIFEAINLLLFNLVTNDQA